jgi:hypothetical protein
LGLHLGDGTIKVTVKLVRDNASIPHIVNVGVFEAILRNVLVQSYGDDQQVIPLNQIKSFVCSSEM